MLYLDFFGNADKNGQHNAAHALLARGLYEEYGIEKPFELTYSANGKPFLRNFPDIHFNLSHCASCAACAVDKSEIGVDVETLRNFSPRTAKRVCTLAELETVKSSLDFIRIWTLKESYFKATGQGIFKNPQNAVFIINGSVLKTNIKTHIFYLIEEKGHIIAVCVKEEDYEKKNFCTDYSFRSVYDNRLQPFQST